jgi:hypothetical protein
MTYRMTQCTRAFSALVGAVLLYGPATVFAQEGTTPPAEPPPAVAAPAPEGAAAAAAPAEPAKKWTEKVEVGGFVDVYFTGNFNGPAPRVNNIRNFDVRANEFNLSLVEFNITKKAEPVGFRLDFDYGPTTDLVHSVDPIGGEVVKHIQQAYVSGKLNLAKGLTIDAGKFVTALGNEVIESQDNWNYSRSVTFAYAIPYYHTGVRGTLQLTDELAAMLMVVNGWNSTIDNNDFKSFHLNLTYASKSLDAFFNYMGGAEQTNNDDNLRHVFDGAIKLKPSDALAFQIYGVFGTEADAVAGPPVVSPKWYGFAGLVRYAFSETCAAAFRGELYKDPDGYTTATGVDTQILDFTLTGEARIADHMLLRGEFRFDKADQPIYAKSKGATTDNQATLGISAVAYF